MRVEQHPVCDSGRRVCSQCSGIASGEGRLPRTPRLHRERVISNATEHSLAQSWCKAQTETGGSRDDCAELGERALPEA